VHVHAQRSVARRQNEACLQICVSPLELVATRNPTRHTGGETVVNPDARSNPAVGAQGRARIFDLKSQGPSTRAIAQQVGPRLARQTQANLLGGRPWAEKMLWTPRPIGSFPGRRAVAGRGTRALPKRARVVGHGSRRARPLSHGGFAANGPHPPRSHRRQSAALWTLGWEPRGEPHPVNAQVESHVGHVGACRAACLTCEYVLLSELGSRGRRFKSCRPDGVVGGSLAMREPPISLSTCGNAP
jgi:hypothetical protein